MGLAVTKACGGPSGGLCKSKLDAPDAGEAGEEPPLLQLTPGESSLGVAVAPAASSTAPAAATAGVAAAAVAPDLPSQRPAVPRLSLPQPSLGSEVALNSGSYEASSDASTSASSSWKRISVTKQTVPVSQYSTATSSTGLSFTKQTSPVQENSTATSSTATASAAVATSSTATASAASFGGATAEGPTTGGGDPVALAAPPKAAKAPLAAAVAAPATGGENPAVLAAPPKAAKAKSKSTAKGKAKSSAKVEKAAAPRQENASDGEVEAWGCPANKSDFGFEAEMRKVKKGLLRSDGTFAPDPDKVNAMLSTEASKDDRKNKKDFIISFYRGEYSRVQKDKEKVEQNAAKQMKQAPSFDQYDPAAANGLKISNGHRPMPRPDGVQLPKDFRQPVGCLSKAMLRKFSCDAPRKLVCIHGDLFEVSDRPDKYGAAGPYWYMAGHDLTWGLLTANDGEDALDYFYDIFKIQPQSKADRKLQGLMSWWCFYEKEYGSPVGRLDVYDKEWELPACPQGELDTECSVM